MRLFALGLASVLAVFPVALSLAQQEPDHSSSVSNGAPAPRTARNESQPPALDVDELGLSLGRIRRDLERRPSTRETFDGQRLRSYVQVYGVAPRIRLFHEGESTTTPAPYGGMTHSEFLDLVTPREFRSPAANLSNIGIAIADWAKKKAREKKEREERERRRNQ
jgi:hypothetical protein